MAFDPKDEETIAAIAKAVKDAVQEETEGLKAKNSDLITRLQKAQKGATIDPAEHSALQSELDDVQTKLAASDKALKAATKEVDKHKEASEGASKTVHDLLVNNGLTAALLEAGVKNPVYQKAAKAILSKEEFKFEGEGADRVAKVGDKSLADFVKEWSGGDEGKAFVSAPGNGGGGSKGGGGESVDNETLSKMSPEARLAKINERADAGAA